MKPLLDFRQRTSARSGQNTIAGQCASPDQADIQLGLSHLGYLPSSPKTVTLVARKPRGFPCEIPFYIRQNCFRMPRKRTVPAGFSERFPYPYDLLDGTLIARKGTYYTQGTLRRIDSRWGTFWQGDFSKFRQAGSYQIETQWQVSAPFMISENRYDRILLGYMNFLRSQRCGCEVFGVHPACHLDDGVLDSDGSPWPVTGGWHDAGDFRKWLNVIQYHLEALVTLRECKNPDIPSAGGPYNDAVLDELAWGNRFFHGMITREGQVFEDVGGGSAPPGSHYTYERHWWFENHAGCFADASDNRWTDNIPRSGDERKVRTTYNPLVQFAFVHTQARVARVLPAAAGRKCLALAEKAWRYGERRGHDQRTLFITAQLRAALELMAARSSAATAADVERLATELLSRQDAGRRGLSGYFLEQDGADAFRSLPFSADPALALLRLWELRARLPASLRGQAARAKQGVERYIHHYLMADAASNPFGLTPYGVYLHPPYRDRQRFRDAGNGRGVRTFLHPFNPQGIVHGTGGVLMNHAHLLARAGVLCSHPPWQHAAERLLHWTLGHNTCNRSLFTSIGYRQPVGYSFRISQLPEALLLGFVGRPDDSPYLEESTAIEWNTLEYWSVPYLQAAMAVCYL